MSTSKVRKEDIIEGVLPSMEDIFYLEWGKETLKENISILNDTFKLFITLDTILLSAYLGFYEKVLENLPSLSWQTIIPALCVIISLTTSLIGIYPFPKSVNLSAPQEIKKYKEIRLKFKSICLMVAAFTLVCGFIVLLVARILPIPALGPTLQPTLQPTLVPTP